MEELMSDYDLIKRNARSALRGNWAISIALVLVINFLRDISIFFNGQNNYQDLMGNLIKRQLANLTLEVCISFLLSGVACIFLNMLRSGEFNLGSFKEGYKGSGRTFFTVLLMNVYIFAWSSLFIIPGIVATFKYSLTMYILRDNPELNPNDCISRSKELMYGYKGYLFGLYLSYLGWIVLSVISGIAVSLIVSKLFMINMIYAAVMISIIFMAPVHTYIKAGVTEFYRSRIGESGIEIGASKYYASSEGYNNNMSGFAASYADKENMSHSYKDEDNLNPYNRKEEYKGNFEDKEQKDDER